MRVREDRQPGVESVAGGVHDADDDGAFFGVGAADLVGPGHGEGAVGDGSSICGEEGLFKEDVGKIWREGNWDRDGGTYRLIK